MMKAIFLIGFMGAGKTTVGRELSEQISFPVVDTDEEIIKRANMTINDIFATKGETAFRKLESKILREMKTTNNIVTTGGGIILNEKNRNWLRSNGIVVFLYCDPSEIIHRLKGDKTRPLLQDGKEATLYKLYEERLHLYKKTAHLTIDTTNKSIPEIAKEILASLN